MTAAYVGMEFGAARVRTRKLIVVSIGLHALLFAWLLAMQKIVPEEIGITEITWLEPVVETPAALPAILARSEPTPQREVSKDMPSVHEDKEFFKRENALTLTSPQPQEEEAVQDKLSDRLALLQDRRSEKPEKIAALTTPNPVGRNALASAQPRVNRDRAPTELDRRANPNAKPIELKRAPAHVQQSGMLATVPVPQTDAEPAPARPEETNRQRELAGALLTGPVADRPLVSYRKPTYPEWAKEEVVEGSVTIYFVVATDGRVKENVMIQKTSGFADFDDNAIQALLTWRFEPLAGGATGEQWGTITFHYRLSDVP
ncbi:MAG: TonB family protein [Candidatus Krumholzibacteria bacterium]|nr:TonB family protein [Candidatus Krumholzibacteria bacterium]